MILSHLAHSTVRTQPLSDNPVCPRYVHTGISLSSFISFQLFRIIPYVFFCRGMSGQGERARGAAHKNLKICKHTIYMCLSKRIEFLIFYNSSMGIRNVTLVFLKIVIVCFTNSLTGRAPSRTWTGYGSNHCSWRRCTFVNQETLDTKRKHSTPLLVR